jgi:hypothetical protein
MPEQIIIALISALIGGLLVAVVNHLFTRRKTEAEAEKFLAEAERMRAEAEKVKVETKQFIAHSNPNMADKSMAEEIRESEKIVYLMGISLRRFFRRNVSESAAAILEIYNRDPKPHIKVLLLDYLSDDARTRASSETPGEYEKSLLYKEIRETIDAIQTLFPDIEIRLYKNQISFLLITDKTIFVEPYHYGAPITKEFEPLLEFQKAAHKSGYEQFLRHFNYVFDEARVPNDEDKRK